MRPINQFKADEITMVIGEFDGKEKIGDTSRPDG